MNDTAESAKSEPVSLDQVLRVAELAQLALTPEEQQEMLRDLNSILSHVAQLNKLDTASIPAMAQVHEILLEHADRRQSGTQDGDALRQDALRASLDRKDVMAVAPETDGVYFKVPRVIER